MSATCWRSRRSRKRAPRWRCRWSSTIRWSPSCLRTPAARKQKEQWLRRLATGEAIGAFALSEPDAGTDAANQMTKAAKTGRRLSHHRTESLGGECRCRGASRSCSRCTRPGQRGQGVTAFLVPMDTPGITRTARADSLGVRGLGLHGSRFRCRGRRRSGARIRGSGIPPRDVGAPGRPRRHRRAGAGHRRGGHQRGDRASRRSARRSVSRSRTTRRFNGCSPTRRPSSKRRGC